MMMSKQKFMSESIMHILLRWTIRWGHSTFWLVPASKKASLKNPKYDNPPGLFLIEVVKGTLEYINEPGLTVFKTLYVAYSDAKLEYALQIMVVNGTFGKIKSLTRLSYLLSLMAATSMTSCCLLQLSQRKEMYLANMPAGVKKCHCLMSILQTPLME